MEYRLGHESVLRRTPPNNHFTTMLTNSVRYTRSYHHILKFMKIKKIIIVNVTYCLLSVAIALFMNFLLQNYVPPTFNMRIFVLLGPIAGLIKWIFWELYLAMSFIFLCSFNAFLFSRKSILLIFSVFLWFLFGAFIIGIAERV